MVDDDRPYIATSMLQSIKRSYPFDMVPQAIYYYPQKKIIQQLLDKCTTLVACFPEDPSEIIGYIIYQFFDQIPIIHYLYVRTIHWNKKIANTILKQVLRDNMNTVIVTSISDFFPQLKHRFPPYKFVYDPFFIQTQLLDK